MTFGRTFTYVQSAAVRWRPRPGSRGGEVGKKCGKRQQTPPRRMYRGNRDGLSDFVLIHVSHFTECLNLTKYILSNSTDLLALYKTAGK